MQETRQVQGGGKLLEAAMLKEIEAGFYISQVIRLREVGKYLLLLDKPEVVEETE